MLGRSIYSSWPLFLGMLLLMLSNGLLVTLLTLRASEYGFSETAIGLMQSAYPIGALAGCILAPGIVARVGHVRAFGALASLCSISALVHLVTSDPWSWGAMRMLAGFCFPALYVVAESWLNGQARNETRATLLSIYFIIQAGGSAGGQALLYIPDSSGSLLFVLVSILISLSLVPMLLSAKAGQGFEEPERISLLELLRMSPLGFAASFLNGVAQGALYIGLGIYGVAIGLPNGQVGMLIAALAAGGVVTQFPLGALSDRMDRRLVIFAISLISAVLCFAIGVYGVPTFEGMDVFWAVAVVGGFVVPIYSLCVAHTNDYLKPSQIVSASGALVLVLNAGIVLGPITGALSISTFGPAGLFFALAVIQGLSVLLTVIRLVGGRSRAESPGVAAPVSYAATPVAAALNPEAQED
jgi:MFS family permease